MSGGPAQDASWQVGVTRTLDAAPGAVWELLLGTAGLPLWLGPEATLDPGAGRWVAGGAEGEVRSFRPGEHVRVELPTEDGAHVTCARLAVAGTADGRTVLSLDEERLRDPGERLRRRTHWRGVADQLQAALRDG